MYIIRLTKSHDEFVIFILKILMRGLWLGGREMMMMVALMVIK